MHVDKELIYIDPKDFKNIEVKINYPSVSSTHWYLRWFPFKRKAKSLPVCPVTNIEMQIEALQLSLELFPEHVDKNKMLEEISRLISEVKDIKCTCV